MNKYQEALEYVKLQLLNCGNCEGDENKEICKTKCINNINLSYWQELIDKEKVKSPEFVGKIELLNVYKCKICNHTVAGCDNYCRNCGQKLKEQIKYEKENKRFKLRRKKKDL